MMFALDFVLGLIMGAAITALAAMALFSYREYQRETAAETRSSPTTTISKSRITRLLELKKLMPSTFWATIFGLAVSSP